VCMCVCVCGEGREVNEVEGKSEGKGVCWREMVCGCGCVLYTTSSQGLQLLSACGAISDE